MEAAINMKGILAERDFEDLEQKFERPLEPVVKSSSHTICRVRNELADLSVVAHGKVWLIGEFQKN